MRETDLYILFWGSCFSNFFNITTKNGVKTLFVADGKEWKTSEQYFMWLKAKFFNDEEIAEQICHAEEPQKAKALGRKVKNFDAKKWSDVSSEMMYKACFAKFSQNEFLKKELLSDKRRGKKFVEASPIDVIWGIGLHFSDPKAEDESNWKGENRLGKVLDRVREELLDNS